MTANLELFYHRGRQKDQRRSDETLEQLTHRLGQTRTFDRSVVQILDDVVALHGAEYGNVQLIKDDEILIVAQRGLPASFLKAFSRVRATDGCACGRALRTKKTVVIPDVQKDPEFFPYRKEAEKARLRAVQSTPLITPVGELVGVVSTHFANAYQPTPIEISTLQDYAPLAAGHLISLLRGIPLSARAEEMNRRLFAELANIQDKRATRVSAKANSGNYADSR